MRSIQPSKLKLLTKTTGSGCRQFNDRDPDYSGTRIHCDEEEFILRVHKQFQHQGAKLAEGYAGPSRPSAMQALLPPSSMSLSPDHNGILPFRYAPFCKHVFIKNFTGATLGALAITASNRHLLQSGYTSRRPEELAVLSR